MHEEGRSPNDAEQEALIARNPGLLSHAEKARMHQLLADHEEIHAKGEQPPHADRMELHALVAADPERPSLLLEGRIPLTPAEHDAVDALAAKHPGAPVSMTRRDPGNSGPLLVHVGDDTHEVHATGRARKQRRPKPS